MPTESGIALLWAVVHCGMPPMGPQPNRLGWGCSSPSECVDGLTCLPNGGDDVGGRCQLAPGVCTRPCDRNADCAAIEHSVCLDLCDAGGACSVTVSTQILVYRATQ